MLIKNIFYMYEKIICNKKVYFICKKKLYVIKMYYNN